MKCPYRADFNSKTVKVYHNINFWSYFSNLGSYYAFLQFLSKWKYENLCIIDNLLRNPNLIEIGSKEFINHSLSLKKSPKVVLESQKFHYFWMIINFAVQFVLGYFDLKKIQKRHRKLSKMITFGVREPKNFMINKYLLTLL